MIKLCCTQQILKKLKLDPLALKAQEPVQATAALGTWYAKYIINERQHAIVLVNDKTRMCLVTTAKDIQHLPERLEAALAETLTNMDVQRHFIEQEVVHYRDVCYSTTTSAPDGRSVLGSINQYIVTLEVFGITDRPAEAWNIHFLKWPCRDVRGLSIRGMVEKQLYDFYGGTEDDEKPVRLRVL